MPTAQRIGNSHSGCGRRLKSESRQFDIKMDFLPNIYICRMWTGFVRVRVLALVITVVSFPVE
jgi:hypothetical protein